MSGDKSWVIADESLQDWGQIGTGRFGAVHKVWAPNSVTSLTVDIRYSIGKGQSIVC
jgi:hypothetical protein